MFSKIKAVRDLRTQAKHMQKVLEEVVEVGTGERGAVTITINGNMQVTQVTVADDAVGNKGKIESGVKEAVTEAMKKIQKQLAVKMKDMGQMQDLMKQLGM
jgi:DNA-binding protein YbaB